MGDRDTLTGDQVMAEGLADWRPILGTIRARFATGDFVTGRTLVDRVTDAAEEMNHHPDLDLRYPYVDVTLSSHDVGGITDRDLRLARRISEIAAELGASADPVARQLLELTIDTWDAEQIRPFWVAVLGGEVRDGEVVDPSGQLPTLWFQGTDRHDVPRQRYHPDVWVAPDAARERVDAALAAGGVLESDDEAPSFWVLADAQGNRVCVCTSLQRGS
ncbi:4a-hydroxytetrahydrobiopterin dehydratase [Nocardioides coralli]|uniref:4a-hydroxytetrahydrobiopterin dehydratase n=1 Tax=Nocardioides coralli TaxID=2872154 RepID=UPI001CA3F9DC|nr:4a-hydroxytetrahydrobiopterin dehydratase [Nocardioides coralli]QZY29552.1 4a-hydroxytetrahydrobiopterin dehydratase [Nocardioides coralli]